MGSKDFSTTISVKASPQKAFAAVNKVRGWWSENIEGCTDGLHGEFKVDFKSHWWAFRIVEIVPHKRIVWLATGSYMPWNASQAEWTGTKIHFDIDRKEGLTEIRFTHEGLTPSCNCFDGCAKGWTGYMHQSLKAFINTGQGTPDFDY